MDSLFYLLIGIVLAAVVTFLYGKMQTASLHTLLKAKDEELNALKTAHREQDARVSSLAEEHARLRASCSSQERELVLLHEQLREKTDRADEWLKENKRLTATAEAQARELELLREKMAEEERKRLAQFAEQLRMVEEQMKNATQEMLKQRAQELTATNSTQMGAIIDPLKETIKEMKTAMDSSRDSHTKNTASLEKAIEEVMKRTTEIGNEADKLANALRNESKTQGNWGEIVLNELLSSQGLKEGIHYEVQTTLRDADGKAVLHDESGKRMIPDVILHYPDGKDAVIDSKVSLTAFVDYRQADTDEQRQEALERHLRSLRQHVRELSRKDYGSYIKAPRQALSYVIMFVPNESALQLALYNDALLWREAFESGVFITSEQNLIAALRMIQLAWTQVQQARNQEEVFELANQLIKRMSDFLKLFEEVGARLEAASATFGSAKKKLYTGQQSILGSANKLVKLGAKVDPKKPIPEAEPDNLLEE